MISRVPILFLLHLLRSDNNGESFDDFQGTYSVPPEDWDDDLLLTDVSMGYTDGMPMYVGGYYFDGDLLDEGVMYRWDPESLVPWTHGEFVDNHVTALAASPAAPNVVWVALQKVVNGVPSYASLLEVHVVSGGTFESAVRWTSDGLTNAEDYTIRDVQVAMTNAFSTDVVLTLDTPQENVTGVDHTVVKRWNMMMLYAGGPPHDQLAMPGLFKRPLFHHHDR